MRSSTESAEEVLAVAREVYRADPATVATLDDLGRRLREPLRVALVGSVKAGKSTLLNSLLGERVAPTDARECTRIVTWYRYGASPSIRLFSRDGTSRTMPPRRQDERLELDLGDVDVEEVDRLEITWPSELLRDLTLIDTPGTVSMSADVSSLTDAFLMPEDGASGADAVMYLLRSLHTSDVSFLRNLHERTRHGVSAVGAVAVLSRVDELGAGRLGAMISVNQAVDKLRNDPALAGVCETVVPVAGLLGLGAATLRQSDFVALSQLEGVSRDRMRRLMASPEFFIAAEDAELPSQQARAGLVDRLGLYGIRLAMAVLRGGVKDAPDLATELGRRSGFDELRRVLDVNFVQRRLELKAHSVVLAVHRLALADPVAGSDGVVARAEEHLVDAQAFREMQLLGRVVGGRVGLDRAQLTELERVLGGRGTSAHDRLGDEERTATPDELRASAIEHVRRWRALAANPLLDRATVESCRVAVRSCEGVVAELDELVVA